MKTGCFSDECKEPASHSESPGALHTTFAVGDWVIDPDMLTLRRGDQVTRVEARPMTVLQVLAHADGRVVARDTLVDAVWGRTVVGYGSLTRCIAELRRALDDDAKQPRYIETVPKRGYRVMAAVRPEQQARETSRLSVRLLAASLTVAVATVFLVLISAGRKASTPSPGSALAVAVLPLTVAGNAGALGTALSTDIADRLAQHDGLHIWVGTEAPGTTATFTVSGQVQRHPEHIVLRVQLSDKRGALRWARRYIADERSLDALQQSIVDDIARDLGSRLAVEHARRYTVAPDAFRHFIVGQGRYFSHTASENQAARVAFQQAVASDPGFGRAYSAIALTHIADARQGWADASSSRDLALAAARRGVLLAPEHAQTNWALAYVHLFLGAFDKAEAAARQATALDDRYADAYPILAICALQRDAPGQAVRLARRAMELNPAYPAAHASILGQALYAAGDPAGALPALHEALHRNPRLVTARVFQLAALADTGRTEAAHWAAAELISLAPTFSAAQVTELVAGSTPAVAQRLRQRLGEHGL